MGLHCRRGIDIAHHCVARMGRHEIREPVGRATVGKRASGTEIRHQHLLVGTKYLGRLSHEMDSRTSV